MAGTAKVYKVGISLGGNDLIRPKLTTTALASVGELGFDGSYLKFYAGGNERSIGGTGTNALRINELKEPNASVSWNSQKITNLLDPTSDQDAATKAYVDAVATGLDIKKSVRVATTANLVATRTSNVLTADANGAITVDGVTLAVDDRVLVKNQSTGADNGIYVVTDTGDGSNPFILTRSLDADNSPSGEVTAGLFTFVEQGTTNQDSGWVLTTDNPITLNTTSLSFSQFSGAGNIVAGAGLTKTGNTLDVISANTGIVVNTDDIALTLASPSGLEISSGLAIADSSAGNGLVISSKVLAVGAGNGITVNANDVAVASTIAGNGLTYSTGVVNVVSGNSAIVANADDITLTLATNPGLVISSGLAVASTIAGNGLTFTSGVVNVVSGNSAIVANVDDITLTLASGSGLVISGGLAIASTLAGQGLVFSSGVVDIASANTGITINANNIELNLASGSGLEISSGLKIDTTVVARKFVDTTTIEGDGSTTDFVITHSLSNQWVSVTVIDKTSLEDVVVDIERTSTSTVTVKFSVAPIVSEDYAVIVVG